MVSMWLFMDLDPIIALKRKENKMMHLRILIADHVLEILCQNIHNIMELIEGLF